MGLIDALSRPGQGIALHYIAWNVSLIINPIVFFPCVELSLTVPITNSLAFLFTVLGEYFAEGKVITRGMYPCSHS